MKKKHKTTGQKPRVLVVDRETLTTITGGAQTPPPPPQPDNPLTRA